jgi:tetratricopeptide (TPR) repeat protein
MLMKAFHNLTTILRFGNKDYYQGDLDRAFANYSSALEFFQSTGNNQGEGIALSNLANVYHHWKDFKNAKENYEKAISIARQRGDKRALANRLNNLAALNSETGDARLAEALYNEALAIDKEAEDKHGEAQRLRNMAIMYTGTGEYGMAQDCLAKAQEIDMGMENDTGLCYDKFYSGLLFVKQKKIDEGLEIIENALSMAIELEDPYLKLNILKELTINYKFSSSKAKAHKYRAEYESLKRKLQPKKFVCFVLDCSGSMRPRIQAAREGAKYIFENYVNPQDEIAIIIFHSICEILLSPTVKAGNEQKIEHIFDDIENTMYQTAFYDALGVAIDFLNTHAKNEQRWIIALTDGQDNTSTKYCLREMGRFQMSQKRKIPLGQYINDNMLALNMIIVGVGNEIVGIGNELRFVENDIKNLVSSIKRGTYIPVPDAGDISDKIKDAFLEVGEILAELEVENFDVFVEGDEGGASR